MWLNLFLLLFSQTNAHFVSDRDAVLLELYHGSPANLVGDIVFDLGPPGEEISAVWSKLWPGGVVPYFISPYLSINGKNNIINAMQEIQQVTCIQFVPKTDEDSNYIIITNFGSACFSRVGRHGGPQQLNLGGNCANSRKVILHELMHALGFTHEHNREDRDQYITVNYANILKRNHDDFKKHETGETVFITKEYAFDSIMHYFWNAFAIDPKQPTILPKKTWVRREQLGGVGDHLSQVDVQRIKQHYECSGARRVFTTTAPPPPPPPRDDFDWKTQADGVTWAMNCDFYGHDLKKIEVKGEHCWWKCTETPRCDHFTWRDGTCFMKTGFNAQFTASRSQGAVCGYKTTARISSADRIPWNRQADGISWAMGCDFYGDDLYEKQMEGKDCGWKCREDRHCTHFTWNNYNGGTCWMKKGYKTKNPKAKIVSDLSVCGFIHV